MRFANATNNNVQKLETTDEQEQERTTLHAPTACRQLEAPSAPTPETGRSTPTLLLRGCPRGRTVGCDSGSVLLAGWSLSSGPDRIIASNYMVDYQLLVSV